MSILTLIFALLLSGSSSVPAHTNGVMRRRPDLGAAGRRGDHATLRPSTASAAAGPDQLIRMTA